MAKKIVKGSKAKAQQPEKQSKYKPTDIALGQSGKGKPQVIVGARRIEAFKGEVLDRTARYWSQLKYVRVGKAADGRLHLTTVRAAAAAGLELVE